MIEGKVKFQICLYGDRSGICRALFSLKDDPRYEKWRNDVINGFQQEEEGEPDGRGSITVDSCAEMLLLLNCFEAGKVPWYLAYNAESDAISAWSVLHSDHGYAESSGAFITVNHKTFNENVTRKIAAAISLLHQAEDGIVSREAEE